MYEDGYLDSFWEEQYEIPDAHDEWDEWEKDRLCEDRELDEPPEGFDSWDGVDDCPDSREDW